MRKYFPQGVLWCKKPEREHGARQPLPLTAAVFFACAAMPRNRAKRDAKNSRSAERGCSSVLPPPNRRRIVGARNPAPPLAGYAAQSRKARCKKQPERRVRLFLCPPAAEQAANGWSPQPCPTTLAGYAAPYAAETSRYVPPLYTYPTKFMHNLCHIVM